MGILHREDAAGQQICAHLYLFSSGDRLLNSRTHGPCLFCENQELSTLSPEFGIRYRLGQKTVHLAGAEHHEEWTLGKALMLPWRPSSCLDGFPFKESFATLLWVTPMVGISGVARKCLNLPIFSSRCTRSIWLHVSRRS